MSAWGEGSFGVSRKIAEKVIAERLHKKPGTEAPNIDFDKMTKGPEQLQKPQFHGPIRSNTLSGEDQCSQSP
jgi:hypothetical protein